MYLLQCFSDSEVYASDSPSPLVKFEMSNDQDNECTEDDHPMHHKDDVKVEVKKPHKFIYPRLTFFGGGGLSSSVADSCATATPDSTSGSSQAKFSDTSKMESIPTTTMSNIKQSPYTFFAMDSEDDFDPYG